MSLELKASAVIPALNNLVALQPWLRPGLTSLLVGAHIDAIQPVALRISSERQGMIDEVAARYPETYPDDEPDEKLRGTPHPNAGQPIIVKNITLFKSAEAGAQFKEREEALMGSVMQFSIPDDMRLTLELFKKLDSERLTEPRSMNGMRPSDAPTVDFGALLPLFLKKEFTKDGVQAPITGG